MSASARPRLHAFLKAGALERRAHRDSARVLLRQADAAGRERAARRAGRGRARRRWPRRSTSCAVRAPSSSIRRTSPASIDPDKAQNFLAWSTCGGLDNAKGKDADCSVVLKYGMKRDFNAWLATLGPTRAGEDARGAARVQPRAFGAHGNQVRAGAARHLGRDGRRCRSRALGGRPREGRAARRHPWHRRGHDRAQAGRAAVPGGSGAALAAKPGYPTVIVPFALVPYAPPPATGPGGGRATPRRFLPGSNPNRRPSASASPARPARSPASSSSPTRSNKRRSAESRRRRRRSGAKWEIGVRVKTARRLLRSFVWRQVSVLG